MQQVKFIFIILVTFLQLFLIFHNSIRTYVEQQYHNFTESHNICIHYLGVIYQSIMLKDNMFFNYADKMMTNLSSLLNSKDLFFYGERVDYDLSESVVQMQKKQDFIDWPNEQDEGGKIEKERQKSVKESHMPTRMINNPQINIFENSSVMLIGDSMMQGIAPHILRKFKKINLRGINLSKHSTGLTYKSYFNWATTIQEVFNQENNIALVVILLGANDPWTMRRTIAFKTPRWEEIYVQRIEEIIHIAKAHNAQVAWYEVPFVKDKNLNDKIIYLNSLYERVVKENGGYFLRSNGLITQGGKYSAFIKNDKDKSCKVRLDDGVHFSTRGYQIMADIFLNSLQVQPLPK